MSSFDQVRADLAASRQKQEEQRKAALLAREAAKQAEKNLAQFLRVQRPGTQDERQRLERVLREAQTQALAAEDQHAAVHSQTQRLTAEFAAFTDPRTEIARWQSDIPVLLFPLRLETRFKAGTRGEPQLWVRVFPDTCLVDSFEESLTEHEIADAATFWAAMWRAGGTEARERAAWRNLAAAYGSGRASWIIQTYLPLNPGDKPPRTDASDVLLVITAPTPLPAATLTYWQRVWKAGGDAAELDSAYTALAAAVGQDTARDIVTHYVPVNLADTPAPGKSYADTRVAAAVLQLTSATDLATRRSSWSSAPRAALLPDRFVLSGYRDSARTLQAVSQPVTVPLIAGPDPNASPEQQLAPNEDTLQIPDSLAWMFDFERALADGMALRVDLTPEQARDGFDRIVVAGIRLGDAPGEALDHVQALMTHHVQSRTGLEILPQGTPTNNTEKEGAGYSFKEDPDQSFTRVVYGASGFARTPDPLQKTDGQWLADMLGFGEELLVKLPHSRGLDQSESRAMQIALWPGTLGYMMKTLLAPVFTEQDVAAVRQFFTRFVSGRGPLPVLRIGRQPYGILPTTAFSRINWFTGSPEALFAGKLHALLVRAESDWSRMLDRVSAIGTQGGDPHQVLLDVLGLHPGSVEYYPLQAEGVDHKFLEMALIDNTVATDMRAQFPPVLPLALLRAYGYAGDAVPELLDKIYKARQTPLDGPLVDDRPLSETNGIRNYAGSRNYIQWLRDAAAAGIEAVQREDGFDGGKTPTALLYLMLRHALQLGMHAVAARLLAGAGMVKDVMTLNAEPAFVHISAAHDQSESRYAPLFRPAETITGSSQMLLGDYIARNLTTVDTELAEQIQALQTLSLLPTARLERLFAEHVDTVGYRLDAWQTGLLAWRLSHPAPAGSVPVVGAVAVRTDHPGNIGRPAGLYVGAYGWLEDLRPGTKVLTPANLPPDLAEKIDKGQTAPLQRDSTNGGLIHAPSLNHATTAAVLRSGYTAHDGGLAVNVTSHRIRAALGILEGIRGGQSLGALLGYQLERYIHDHGPLTAQDLVYHLRRAFPLAANQITDTQTSGDSARESIAAMNVVDGRKLVERVQTGGVTRYPFGVTELPRRAANQESAITEAVSFIRDINDAVADLALAEGVHQAVLGNYDRSAGTLDAFAKGAYPPEPDVVRTPRTGTTLTLRTAIHLPPNPSAPSGTATPLAVAAASVNAWLAARLPGANVIGCTVVYTDRIAGASTPFVSQADLGLQPIDLVLMAGKGVDQAWSELDEQIIRWLHAGASPRLDREIRILHTQRVPGKVTWFELRALLSSLHALVCGARPLQPADLMRHNDSSRDQQAQVSVQKAVVQSPRDALFTAALPALTTLVTALQNPATTVDAGISQFDTTVGGLGLYRLPQTSTQFAFEWRAQLFSRITTRVAERLQVWNEHLQRFDAMVRDYDTHAAGMAEGDRIQALQSTEALVRAHVTQPTPAASSGYRTSLDASRSAFAAKRDALAQIVGTPRPTLTQLVTDVQTQLSADTLPALSDYDLSPFALDDEMQEVGRFRARLIERATLLRADLVKRIAAVDALLAKFDAADALQGVTLLQEAAKLLFGDDFPLIPKVTLPAGAADECANAWQHSASGALTRFLRETSGRDFPVDDWLHGVARVREKMHHWENVVLLGEAFGVSDPAELVPLQIPFDAAESWLALEFPPETKIESDRLLYTAHFAEPFDPRQPMCGLLVDEWTEVIPSPTETTGIAFHFDRPNAEPPQVWLLALSPAAGGPWSWDDLLDSIQHALDSAKRRAIEPVHLDAGAYATFLPATFSAYTFPEISISNSLLRNKEIYKRMVRE